MPNVNRASGFTLVEVMVALFVVVMALSALLINSHGIIDNSAYLQEKSVAQWVALNQLELVRIENRRTNQVPSAESTGSEEMLGQEWFWKIKPLRTESEGFMQLEIQVGRDQALKDPVLTMRGLVDIYHRKTNP